MTDNPNNGHNADLSRGRVITFTYWSAKREKHEERSGVVRFIFYGNYPPTESECFQMGVFDLDRRALRTFPLHSLSNVRVVG